MQVQVDINLVINRGSITVNNLPARARLLQQQLPGLKTTPPVEVIAQSKTQTQEQIARHSAALTSGQEKKDSDRAEISRSNAAHECISQVGIIASGSRQTDAFRHEDECSPLLRMPGRRC